jgi:hypothetical protein
MKMSVTASAAATITTTAAKEVTDLAAARAEVKLLFSAVDELYRDIIVKLNLAIMARAGAAKDKAAINAALNVAADSFHPDALGDVIKADMEDSLAESALNRAKENHKAAKLWVDIAAQALSDANAMPTAETQIDVVQRVKINIKTLLSMITIDGTEVGRAEDEVRSARIRVEKAFKDVMIALEVLPATTNAAAATAAMGKATITTIPAKKVTNVSDNTQALDSDLREKVKQLELQQLRLTKELEVMREQMKMIFSLLPKLAAEKTASVAYPASAASPATRVGSSEHDQLITQMYNKFINFKVELTNDQAKEIFSEYKDKVEDASILTLETLKALHKQKTDPLFLSTEEFRLVDRVFVSARTLEGRREKEIMESLAAKTSDHTKK